MKKIALTIMILVGAASTQAYDYPYLTFQTTDGTQKSVSVESLTIAVDNGQLVIANSDGSQTFTLSQLSKMYFSQTADASAISQAETTGSEPVDVFTMGGLSLGRYESLAAAKSGLRPGIYVMKSKSRTLKIAVR